MLLTLENTEPFVRRVLGCQCPDAVFEQIEIVDLRLGELCYQRVLIGNRLLIYLLLQPSHDAARDDFERLIRVGLDERDSNGFNRCRIVLVGTAADPGLEALFCRLSGGDQKLHLHRVREESLHIDPA